MLDDPLDERESLSVPATDGEVVTDDAGEDWGVWSDGCVGGEHWAERVGERWMVITGAPIREYGVEGVLPGGVLWKSATAWASYDIGSG